MTKKTAAAPIAEPTTAPEIKALQAQVADLTARLRKSDEIATDAEVQRLTTEANAQVDRWQREGRITGNATAAVRGLYVAIVTGQKVTAAAFGDMIAALPRFDTTRISAGLKPTRMTSDVALEDFSRAATDINASQRIDAAVRERRKTNPKFTSADLKKELMVNG